MGRIVQHRSVITVRRSRMVLAPILKAKHCSSLPPAVRNFLLAQEPLVLYNYLAPCSHPRCYNVVTAIHESMKPSIAPCYDFYGYACGGRRGNHVTTDALHRTALLRWVSTVPTPPMGQSALQKAAALLRACMRLTSQKHEDLDAIRGVLKAGGLPFPNMPSTSTYAVIQSIVDVNFDAGIAPLFRLTAGKDLLSGKGYMLYLAPAYDIVTFADFLQQMIVSDNVDVYIRRCAEVVGEPSWSYSALIRAIKSVNQQFLELSATNPLKAELKLSTSYQKGDTWFMLSRILANRFEIVGTAKPTFLVLDDAYFRFLARSIFEPLEPASLSAYVGMYVVWLVSRLASNNLAYSTPAENFTRSLVDLWPRCFSDVHSLYAYVPDQDDTDYVDGFLSVSRITAQYVTGLLFNWTANASDPFVPPFSTSLPLMVSTHGKVQLNMETVAPPTFTYNRSPSLNYAGLGYNVVQQCLRQLYLKDIWDTGDMSTDVLQASVAAHILYNAYMEARRSGTYEARFRQEEEKFGLKPEQLFFVGLCANWCRQNSHQPALAKQLCRSSLRLLTPFDDAFGCTRSEPSTLETVARLLAAPEEYSETDCGDITVFDYDIFIGELYQC
ncbi:hypothetical protein HPB48_002920 [Haemaphysalis longicornis]|uniref:Peptidase M13 N-terminal domain-containing protein n=1 Tax=Haemaphysalis longicornis TaxID=44386 RepID=A0A9J6FDK7_HAELO|nr:hypothetical protein HPB48_002920 [Haemaphysalis longicornis]